MFTPNLPPIRSLLLPDPGWVFVDCDYDRADAQIVAWTSNEPVLKKIFQENIDVHSENAHWVSTRAGVIVPRQKMKSGVHLCLSTDHDVLTRYGWVPITNKPREIMCWDINTEQLSFQEVIFWFDKTTTVTMLDWNEHSFSQRVTCDHTMPYATDKGGFRSTPAYKLPNTARLPKSGYYKGGRPNSITPLEARLWCAIQADATRQHLRWRFHLKKQRKITRLHSLLDCLHIKFSFSIYADKTTMTSFRWPDIPKRLGPYIFDFKYDTMKAYVDEAIYWDGHQGKTSKTFCTMDEEHSLWFATMVHLTGRASQGGKKGLGYTVSVNNRPLFLYSPPVKETLEERILCPTTSTGFFLVRRNGKISVTGNTNYGGKASTLASTLDVSRAVAAQFLAYWFKRFPGIKRWHERTKQELRLQHYIRNVWGFRRFYFERLNTEAAIEQILPQALAWQGQSGVAIAINYAMKNVRRTFSREELRLRLQVHDSLLLQVREDLCPAIFPRIVQAMQVRIPFADPLYIPVSLKWSAQSWGAVKSWKEAA